MEVGFVLKSEDPVLKAQLGHFIAMGVWENYHFRDSVSPDIGGRLTSKLNSVLCFCIMLSACPQLTIRLNIFIC